MEIKKKNNTVEIKGKLISMSALQNINVKNGSLTKQEFVIMTQDQYPKYVCISAWNKIAEAVSHCIVDELITVQISLSSREHNGRWYTEVKCEGFTSEGTVKPEQVEPPK